jgi:macrolide-specific efflux system membrane fusion protein
MLSMDWKTAESSRRSSKRPGGLTFAFVLTVSGLVSACSLLPKEEPVLAPPLVEPAKQQYDLADVKKGEIVKRVKGVANFTPTERVDLSYKQPDGRLKSVKVQAGQTVKKGDVLAELETGSLSYEEQQASLDLQKAKLRLSQLQAQGGDTYAVEIAKLDVESQKLKLQQLQERLGSARLVAPMDGVVTFVTDKKEGDKVDPFQSLVQVANPSKLQLIYTAAAATDLNEVDLGMAATVQVKGKSLPGKVVQTPRHLPANLAPETAEVFKRSVLIALDEVPEGVQKGEAADIEIVTQKKENTLIIPKAGLRSFMGRDFVQVLDGPVKREIDVEKGIVGATEVEILKGLKEGDRVILK